MTRPMRVVLLAGGGGGAKLAAGLAALVPTIELCVVANTGDDFEHLGLLICPDFDSVLYSLAKQLDTKKGWGRDGETWHVLGELTALGGPDWFGVGDRDLALHLLRNSMIHKGYDLSRVAAELCGHFDIRPTRVVPASDQPVRTVLTTTEGQLDFQDYFVGRRCQPEVISIDYVGVDDATPSMGLTAFAREGIDAVIVAPSNPLLSIEPILRITGMPALLSDAEQIVAVSPLIDGQAIKGPLAKIMVELGRQPTSAGWAELVDTQHPNFVNHWIFDTQDQRHADRFAGSPQTTACMNTLMNDEGAATALARAIIQALLSTNRQGCA